MFKYFFVQIKKLNYFLYVNIIISDSSKMKKMSFKILFNKLKYLH